LRLVTFTQVTVAAMCIIVASINLVFALFTSPSILSLEFALAFLSSAFCGSVGIGHLRAAIKHRKK